MKKLMILIFITAPLFARANDSQVSCKFKSVTAGSESVEVELSKCTTQVDSKPFQLLLSGVDNSPCKAGTALTKFINSAQVGETINLRNRYFNHTTEGGAETTLEVLAGARPERGIKLKTKRGCSSTHVTVWGI